MAQTEHGVGVSYKLPDGTMVWTRRDTWAEVQEDVDIIFGEGASGRLASLMENAWAGPKPTLSVVPTPAPVAEPTAEAVAQQLGASVGPTTAFQTCPKCGAVKDRWVEPGVSQRTGKSYPGFYGCPTRNCPGR